MNKVKKAAALVIAICMMAGLFSGCSAAEGKALYDATVKTQSIKSSQNDMKFALRLDATGLNEEDKADFEQMRAALNGANMSMNIKQIVSEDNTISKAQADTMVSVGGMSMNMGVWVDMDLSSSSPKFKEIIKLPSILTSMDPSMAGKEYMVMDLGKMMQDPAVAGQAQSVNYKEIMELSKELESKATVFMAKYLAQYDPGFKFITDAGTKDIIIPGKTVKAHVYQLKLDDKAAKKLIRYTVNNFAENKDAMAFIIDYMKFIQKFAVSVPGEENPMAELDKLMADFESQKTVLLGEFNKAMDKLESVPLVGAKGINIEYAIDENGYIISQSGNMDFLIDTAKLESLADSEESVSQSFGVYNVGIDFSMLTYDINKIPAIVMPTVTPENSINYTDMLNSTKEDLEVQ